MGADVDILRLPPYARQWQQLDRLSIERSPWRRRKPFRLRSSLREDSMVDRYTKALLTVIAAALVSIVVQNSISSSAAQSQIQKVQTCDGILPD